MRLSTDVGGTFTDLVIEDQDGLLRQFKAATTPDDPVKGVLAVVDTAAQDFGVSSEELLATTNLFVHATTRATNAILTGQTARTALLTTQGHPDVLLLREGGRTEPFNNTVPYPEPYVPRSLTFEVEERIGSRGEVVLPLNESAVLEVVQQLKAAQVEAIGVCLIWSIVNPQHELRVGELLSQHLPDIAHTLSHRLNPCLREYRRASSTCMDASLKPIMSHYLNTLEMRLRDAGFNGRLLTVTSQGSVIDAADMAAAPVHSIKSGPSMAPVAGRFYSSKDATADTAIVADTGGTTYDVSLVRRAEIPWTRETWLGERLRGHMTGFPSVDVRSVGAGGGSIAWVDVGGMLHVGPRSAGSVPGPVCYAKGGTEPTVTDAALVLGYIDPQNFLGGAIPLDVAGATQAIQAQIGDPLVLDQYAAADAILSLVSENMVQAIEDITINQGMDPQDAVLVGGGGAAGLNVVRIARRLRCSRIVIPGVGAALSAAGALMSDLATEFSTTRFITSERFEFDAVNEVLRKLEQQCREFLSGAGTDVLEHVIEFSVEARYPHQVWEVEVPLQASELTSQSELDQLVENFHRVHEELFSYRDVGSIIELVTWRARARAKLPRSNSTQVYEYQSHTPQQWQRLAYFPEIGQVEALVQDFQSMKPGAPIEGPAVIESNFTTVVVDPGAVVERTPAGSLSIVPSIMEEGKA
ncbi:MAG: hydantoinase/oxoprolinase family protein [Gammaproteobacteria bacterium]|nr:hydantoinase/oxoprolinase family protein [Gammaproteobacteria bacterium]